MSKRQVRRFFVIFCVLTFVLPGDDCALTSYHGKRLPSEGHQLYGIVTDGILTYSRFVKREDLMRSPARQRILQLVNNEPGLDVRHVPERLGVARGTALYHVQMLERNSLLRVLRDGRKQFLFLPDVSLKQLPDNLTLAWHAVAAAIIGIVRARGGTTREELRLALPNTPKRTRNYILARLAAQGIVRVSGPGAKAEISLIEGKA